MDYNVSMKSARSVQPGAHSAVPYDFMALERWEKSASGSAQAGQRLRTWLQACDPSAPLDLGQCDLRSCPPLPPEVQDLCLGFNPSLDTLPQPLPAALKKLNINFCNFTQLPHQWPHGLIELLFVTNQVAELPDTLPAGLQVICATNNRISSLPMQWPDGLQKLYLAANCIAELDPGLLSLPNCIHLNLCNNPLSDASKAMLHERTSAPAYAGPTVKIGFAGDRIDHSTVLPAARKAELRKSEVPPIIHRQDGPVRYVNPRTDYS